MTQSILSRTRRRLLSNASKSEMSVPKGELQIRPYETLLRNRLQRIATSLNLDGCLDTLIRRLHPRSRNQWFILHDSEELEYCARVEISPKRLSRKGQRKVRSWRVEHYSATDSNLRSTMNWYFWSPAETVKNCPTLQFLRIHLAPPNVWL